MTDESLKEEILVNVTPNEIRAALLMTRRDVQEAEFVRTGLVISRRSLHRIARIDKIDKVDAFDDTTILHVETGNDADLQHGSILSCHTVVPILGGDNAERFGSIKPAVI